MSGLASPPIRPASRLPGGPGPGLTVDTTLAMPVVADNDVGDTGVRLFLSLKKRF